MELCRDREPLLVYAMIRIMLIGDEVIDCCKNQSGFFLCGCYVGKSYHVRHGRRLRNTGTSRRTGMHGARESMSCKRNWFVSKADKEEFRQLRIDTYDR